MATVCADDATLALIVQMQLEDAEYVKAKAKGKQRVGEANDGDFALRLYLQELADVGLFASDRTMARSLQSAVVADSDAIRRHVQDEAMATRDQAMAVALSRGGTAPVVSSAAARPASTDEDELVQKLSYIYLPVDSTEDSEAEGDGPVVSAESSTWAASRKFRMPPKHECIACGESVPFIDVCRAPCSHEYCSNCLEQLFNNAMVDESLFPPRCCKQTIPLDDNILFLKQSTVTQFRKKRQEFATPNRTYCHRPQCAVFIPAPKYRNGVATCIECKATTCTTCKRASHGNHDCPHDEQLQQVLDAARQEGWQRCQRCWNMVELNTGCNHMTCRCGAQFCYLCGVPWKNCTCAHWDEHRLFERAAAIDVRDHPQEPGPAAIDREFRVDRLMEHLRQNHECTHERWRNRRGPRECEECGDEMPVFIYECRQCHIMACRRCRYNRL